MDGGIEVPVDPANTPNTPTAHDLERAQSVSADVVVLPLGRTQSGVGEYDEQVIGLVKALREAGLSVEFLDPPETRAFTVRRSIEVEILIALLTNLGSAAIWAAGAAIIQRFRKAHPKARVEVYDGSQSSGRDALKAPLSHTPSNASPASPLQDEPGGEAATPHRERTIWRLMLEGKALLGDAALSLTVNEAEAEVAARAALRRLRSALDWAEDGPSEAATHGTLDAAGHWVKTRFGCMIDRAGESYSITCPVRLAHNRVGLSVGGRAHKTCSLCGGDLADCEHVPGQRYLVPGGAGDLGWCRVCLSKDNCEHVSDETYRAPVISIVDRMDLEEVSIVSKPAFPDARIERMTVSVSELAATLGPDFKTGMDVSCDFCLTPCSGLHRPFGVGVSPS